MILYVSLSRNLINTFRWAEVNYYVYVVVLVIYLYAKMNNTFKYKSHYYSRNLQVFLKTYWDDNCIPELKPFIRKSLFLCWMMVVQGPPMCFDWNTKQGSQFDANLYRHYTALGTVVEFVVWPTMFLHKDGPTIAKGVVQPKKELLA